jgi:hypothetical protein
VTADRVVKLRCNYLDTSKPPGERGCREEVADGTYGARTPGLPDGVYLWTTRDARREARKLGWAAGIHAGGTRGGPLDYCPAHKSAKAELAAGPPPGCATPPGGPAVTT